MPRWEPGKTAVEMITFEQPLTEEDGIEFAWQVQEGRWSLDCRVIMVIH